MLHLRHRNNNDAHTDDREETYAGDHRADRAERAGVAEDAAHDRFGGVNVGAAFFGWLVAMGVAVLLTGIVGAVVAAAGSNREITQTEAERQAGTIGISAAVVLLAVLTLGYYAGGYVAGRMSRFDGGRQGAAVWVIGLVATLVALGLGALFGTQYNVFDRVDLPRIPISTEELGYGGVVTGLAVLVLTLLAAVLGGKAGRHYHHRVDKVLRDA